MIIIILIIIIFFLSYKLFFINKINLEKFEPNFLDFPTKRMDEKGIYYYEGNYEKDYLDQLHKNDYPVPSTELQIKGKEKPGILTNNQPLNLNDNCSYDAEGIILCGNENPNILPLNVNDFDTKRKEGKLRLWR